MVTATRDYTVTLRKPHAHQEEIRASKAKRKVVKAGRRSGKTVVAALMCVEKFLAGKRPLYGTPTATQLETWWFEVKRALAELIDAGIYKKNEMEHSIERTGTTQRLRGKTCWNADTLRGDYADFLVLDEYQLMNEDTWDVVGAPMLLDNNGDAMFIYTPPSLRSAGVSKAHDPRHAAKMFKRAQSDTTGRWQAFHFTTRENPYISQEALVELAEDMSRQSYRQEILAEDDELQLAQLVYSAFKESLNKIDRFDVPLSWPVYSGHDFGAANPAALFFARVKLPLPEGAPQHMRYNDLVAFREYLPGAGRNAAQHVDRFKEITAGRDVVRRMGGSHQEDEVRQAYTNQGWTILEPSITRVHAQLDRVIGLMEAGRVFVFSDMLNYLEELGNCLWKMDSGGVITDRIDNEQRFHLCAAARYILSDFKVETSEDFTKTPIYAL